MENEMNELTMKFLMASLDRSKRNDVIYITKGNNEFFADIAKSIIKELSGVEYKISQRKLINLNTGSTVRFITTDEPNELRGLQVDAVVYDQFWDGKVSDLSLLTYDNKDVIKGY